MITMNVYVDGVLVIVGDIVGTIPVVGDSVHYNGELCVVGDRVWELVSSGVGAGMCEIVSLYLLSPYRGGEEG